MVELSLYQGYLRAYLVEIVLLHQSGETPGRIAETLHRRYPHHADLWSCTDGMIRYVLHRVGLLPRPPARPLIPHAGYGGERRQRLIDERDEYVRLDGSPVVRETKGRPIDMGGPRDVWIEDELWNVPQGGFALAVAILANAMLL